MQQLKQYGIPYSLTTLHTVGPNSEEFKKDLEWFAGVCRIVKGLKNLRIGRLAPACCLQHRAL